MICTCGPAGYTGYDGCRQYGCDPTCPDCSGETMPDHCFTIPVAFAISGADREAAAKHLNDILVKHVPGDSWWSTSDVERRDITEVDDPRLIADVNLDCWWMPNDPTADNSDPEPDETLVWVPRVYQEG